MWGIVIVYLLKGVGSYVSSYLMADVGQRVVMDLRNALYRHILGQSAGFFAHRTTGELMSRINNDVGQVQQAVSEAVGDLARESLSLVGFLGLMLYYDRGWVIVSSRARGDQFIRWCGWGARAADDAAPGAPRTFPSAGRGVNGPPHREGLRDRNPRSREVRQAGAQLFQPNEGDGGAGQPAAAMEIVGGIRWRRALSMAARDRRGPADHGEFASFFTAVFLIRPGEVCFRQRELQQAIAASERIFEMLDAPTEVKEQPERTPLAPFGTPSPFERSVSRTRAIRRRSCAA
jgi:subfamily B ATP-binding cassette protein MsbA